MRIAGSIVLPSLVAIGLAVVSSSENPLASQMLSQADVSQLQSKAKAGDAAAQFDLGRAYENANGVPQDDGEAFKWYRLSAEQGNAAAQNNLGIMFQLGHGVEKDKKESVEWFRKAAKQENPNACFNLGAAYYNGEGVGIDDSAAYTWFLLAQEFGSQSGADAVTRTRNEKPDDLVKKELDTGAFERIGDMYANGNGLPKNPAKALVWYRRAGDTGSPKMMVKLAGILLNRSTDATSTAEAMQLCENAAKAHFGHGEYCMGFLYLKGLGANRDLPKAAKFFREALDHDVPMAAWQLGEMYWNGEGFVLDKALGYQYMNIAFRFQLPGAKEEEERMGKQLTPAQLKKAERNADDWIRQHAALRISNGTTN